MRLYLSKKKKGVFNSCYTISDEKGEDFFEIDYVSDLLRGAYKAKLLKKQQEVGTVRIYAHLFGPEYVIEINGKVMHFGYFHLRNKWEKRRRYPYNLVSNPNKKIIGNFYEELFDDIFKDLEKIGEIHFIGRKCKMNALYSAESCNATFEELSAALIITAFNEIFNVCMI